MKYTALQVKTSYSLLNSLNEVTKLVSRAKALGYTSLAITDTNNMFGVITFYQECKKNNIKPIIGIELDVLDKKILLYAKNNNGYKNLIKLATLISERNLTLDDLKEYKNDLILVIPYIYYYDDIYNIYETKFIGYSNIEEKKHITKDKVFINNVSYLYKEDYKYLDYLIMIKEGKTLGEYEFGNNKNMYLLSSEEVEQIADATDIENTFNISNLCNVEITYTPNILPVYDQKIDAYSYLTNLCNKGLKRRLKDNVDKVYQDRLDYELKIINQMGFCNYFLIVWDYVKYAKLNNILVGPGRGSAAGSLVSYTLGITDIDPLKYDLLFERFLNPERVTMPDIDIDFDSAKREEVIEYVINKYGNKKVAEIITFNTLGAKQIVRDVARVLGLTTTITDDIARLVTEKTLTESIDKNLKLKKYIEDNNQIKELFKIALKLEGLPRHISIHAAGVVICKTNLDEIIPLYKNPMGIYTTAYSKDYLEPLGLLKMDFLGISNLTLIAEVIDNIRKNEHLNITFSNIPMDDKKTLEIFRKVKTNGIFQFESYGMRRFLEKLQVSSFDDIIAAIALYRPGPMDNLDLYIRRKEGKEKVKYPHPNLESILKPTYGIIIYQEQIIQIAQVLAGYTLGEADILRRAMSKKKEEVLLKEKPKFISSSVKRGYTEELATEVYDLILKFANYGFNKSHSVGYATVSYKMAFLKTYFFKYFETALLNNVIGSVDKTSDYITEIRQNNLIISLPDINISTNVYLVINNVIVAPLSIIKNIGASIADDIIKEREKGPYKNIIDFVVRLYNKGIGPKIITSLIQAGCFNNLGYNRKTLIENLDNIINYAEISKDIGMVDLPEPVIEVYEEYTLDELLNIQYNTFGFYISNHPVTKYRENSDITTQNVKNYYDKRITMTVLVSRIKEITTKKNDVMAFITGKDEYGEISLTMFPNEYKTCPKIKNYDIIKVTGKVEKRYDTYQVIINDLKVLNKTLEK
jgi:DNA polymerase III subunit alpha